ncbi:GNAT family N-acetyltransferase [Cryobacterium gelidum]|nr:GNAT family N-acetyltransferase [Cryobacterium gelidum]
MAGLVWTLRWEADLSRDEHDALATLLSCIYPEHHATFAEGRSWSGARPEGRVIGYSEDRPVAHLGFIRRTLRINEDSSLLVGDVGLVGVEPSLHGSGIGLRLLEEASTSFHNLALPFGFLTCRPSVVPFYERGGWKELPGQATRMIDNDLQPETYTGPALALPVLASMSEWPSGQTVIRDGLEV